MVVAALWVWWVFYINPSRCFIWAPWPHTQSEFCFTAGFYFSVKSRHKWGICWVCSSEEQLYGTCGLLILPLWCVWSPLASSSWPGTALTQVKAHPRAEVGMLGAPPGGQCPPWCWNNSAVCQKAQPSLVLATKKSLCGLRWACLQPVHFPLIQEVMRFGLVFYCFASLILLSLCYRPNSSGGRT